MEQMVQRSIEGFGEFSAFLLTRKMEGSRFQLSDCLTLFWEFNKFGTLFDTVINQGIEKDLEAVLLAYQNVPCVDPNIIDYFVLISDPSLETSFARKFFQKSIEEKIDADNFILKQQHRSEKFLAGLLCCRLVERGASKQMSEKIVANYFNLSASTIKNHCKMIEQAFGEANTIPEWLEPFLWLKISSRDFVLNNLTKKMSHHHNAQSEYDKIGLAFLAYVLEVSEIVIELINVKKIKASLNKIFSEEDLKHIFPLVDAIASEYQEKKAAVIPKMGLGDLEQKYKEASPINYKDLMQSCLPCVYAAILSSDHFLNKLP